MGNSAGPLLTEDLSGFDGILITHGSDTLSYTAAMAGWILDHLSIPVVLTAADKPLEHPQSNGWENFRAAVELIRTGTPGVYVTYRNPGEEMVTVFGWEEILQADCAADRFGCQNPAPLGSAQNGDVTLARLPRRWNAPLCPGFPVLNRKVLQLLCYPGLDLRQIQPRPETAAVLLRLYHSGTAPVEGEGGRRRLPGADGADRSALLSAGQQTEKGSPVCHRLRAFCRRREIPLPPAHPGGGLLRAAAYRQPAGIESGGHLETGFGIKQTKSEPGSVDALRFAFFGGRNISYLYR